MSETYADSSTHLFLGLGKYSKRGSGFIVAGVCGGAVVPPILGATADAHGEFSCVETTESDLVF